MPIFIIIFLSIALSGSAQAKDSIVEHSFENLVSSSTSADTTSISIKQGDALKSVELEDLTDISFYTELSDELSILSSITLDKDIFNSLGQGEVLDLQYSKVTVDNQSEFESPPKLIFNSKVDRIGKITYSSKGLQKTREIFSLIPRFVEDEKIGTLEIMTNNANQLEANYSISFKNYNIRRTHCITKRYKPGERPDGVVATERCQAEIILSIKSKKEHIISGTFTLAK